MSTKKKQETEWALVGTLPKFSSFRNTKERDAMSSLHMRMAKLIGDTSEMSVSDVGISEKTDKYLQAQLRRYIRKEYSYLSKERVEKEVAWYMLMSSPATLKGKEYEDFVLYKRSK